MSRVENTNSPQVQNYQPEDQQIHQKPAKLPDQPVQGKPARLGYEGRPVVSEAPQQPTVFDRAGRPEATRILTSDASAQAALNDLLAGPFPITADRMKEAIKAGIGDADGQGAGVEFKAFKDFATENKHLLSPGALKNVRIYEETATEARSMGSTGIAQDAFDKMLDAMGQGGYKSPVAGRVIESLHRHSEQRPVDGETMARAIETMVRGEGGDQDFKAYADLKAFVEANPGKLSPEAMQVFERLEHHVNASMDRGHQQLPEAREEALLKQMQNIVTRSQRDGAGDQAIERPETRQPSAPQAPFAEGWKPPQGGVYKPIMRQPQQPIMEPPGGMYQPPIQQPPKGFQPPPIAQQPPPADVGSVAGGAQEVDKGMARGLKSLDDAQEPISAADFAKAMFQGLRDVGGFQGEVAQLKEWLEQNMDKLSPEAKEVAERILDLADKVGGADVLTKGEWRSLVRDMEKMAGESIRPERRQETKPADKPAAEKPEVEKPDKPAVEKPEPEVIAMPAEEPAVSILRGGGEKPAVETKSEDAAAAAATDTE